MPDPSEGARVTGRIVHQAGFLRIECLQVQARDGRMLDRHVVRHPGAVTVVPVLDDGRLVMIRNYRIAVGEWLEEFCAGKLEPGEDPEPAAGRELEEECGYRAGSVRRLGAYLTSPGFCDELMHLYEATALTPCEQALEADEQIEVELVHPDEVQRRIATGQIKDGKTIAAFHLWRASRGSGHGR